MSKGLEALKRLVDTMPLAFIETNSMREIENIEKELKALEIIKSCITGEFELKDNCDIYAFRIYMNYYEYNEWVISKEEYNLLKEVLL